MTLSLVDSFSWQRCRMAAVAAMLVCWESVVFGGSEPAPATFVVDSVVDALDAELGDGRCATVTGSCTLRAAMQEARSHDATIILSPDAAYRLVFEGGSDQEGRTALPPITQAVVILGNGSVITPTSSLGAVRLLRVEREGRLTLHNLTLSGAQHDFQGGAILNHGALVLLRATIRENAAGVNVNVAVPSGGGIFSDGIATLTDSTIAANVAGSYGYADGGGIANLGSMTLVGSTVTENATEGGDFAGTGGGIYNSGTLVIDDCVISQNQTGGSCTGGAGGGIFNNGFLLITNSRIADNNTPLISTVNGGDGGGIVNAGQLILDLVRIEGNRAGSASEDGSGGSGGGVYNYGSLVVVDSEISDNRTGNGGGEGSGGRGGGLFNSNEALLVRSTVAYNETGSGGYYGDARDGGHGGGIFNSGRLEILNATVSHNTTGRGGCCVLGCDRVGSGGQGGGIHNAGALVISSSTVAANVTGLSVESPGNPLCGDFVIPGLGAGIYNDSSVEQAVVTIKQTILAVNEGVGNECAGTLISSGNNLVENTDGCTLTGEGPGDVTNHAALLGPLEDNGGPTRTHSLLPGSPAIGSGGFECPPPDTDQRGRPRVPPCDIGSFESDSVSCAGDCNEDGVVTVDEIVLGMTIVLGASEVDACLSLDRDGSLDVTIDELVGAIANALGGCV